jgi:hypothetical protein
LKQWFAKAGIKGYSQQSILNNSSRGVSRPNVLVYGIGHSGTTILTRMLGLLGWNLGDADEEFAESVSIRALNQKLLRTTAVRDELFNGLRALPEPWAVKDPRFFRTLDRWLSAFGELERPPLLVWIRRNEADVIASYQKRGEPACDTPEKYQLALVKAERNYRLWPFSKIEIDYEDIAAAVALFKPASLGPGFLPDEDVFGRAYWEGS